MDGLNGNGVDGNMNNDDRNSPLLGVRERLFHALFFRLSLTYARVVPVQLRRVIEFIALMKAVVAFFILVYVHITFIHKPTTCLNHLHKSWPRDGILRVEILRNGFTDYSIENSYARERKIREQRSYEMNLLLTSLRLPFEWFGGVQIESSLDDDNISSEEKAKNENENEPENADSDSSKEATNESSYHSIMKRNVSLFNTASWADFKGYEPFDNAEADHFWYSSISKSENYDANQTWLNSSVTPAESSEEQAVILNKPSEMEKFVRAVWPEDEYIVEFSLEYGYLRLSPKVRQKLNIPVKVVTLNPNTDECFGDAIMRYILEHIIGYDDLLMLSIKTLAEQENDKGFLRNVVTGELYRFVTLWMSRASYISAFAIMLGFTLSISMLLRYSHHQIFMFIVNLLQTTEFNSELTVPAAPLFTVILALIGMEAIMSEFFNDSTTAFYIIIIVWMADQYEAICCQRAMTKKHWMKFFYLYQFSFYAYHYRFNGQYSGLALVTAWLFIQHSMIYFFHHYELPMILRRYQLQQFLLSQQATNDEGESVAFLSTDADNSINNNNDYNIGNEQFRFVTMNENGVAQEYTRAQRFSLLFSMLRSYRNRFRFQSGQDGANRARRVTTRVIVTEHRIPFRVNQTSGRSVNVDRTRVASEEQSSSRRQESSDIGDWTSVDTDVNEFQANASSLLSSESSSGSDSRSDEASTSSAVIN